MATTIPVFFRAAPLPQNFRGTPQEFLDAIVARLGIESQEEVAFFVTGSTEPGSDVGPWLKNGVTWWVWSDDDGAYAPQIIEQESLKYAVQNAEPDPDKFLFWIELNANGKSVHIKTYYAGAWRDVYEDTFALYSTTVEMDAAIDTAITDGTKVYPAAVEMGVSQQLNVDGDYHKVEFTDPVFDPDSVFNTTLWRYVVPVSGYYFITSEVQVDNYNAVAADLEFGILMNKNGFPTHIASGASVATPPGQRWYPQVTGIIQADAGDFLEIAVSAADGSSGHVVQLSNGAISVYKIQTS